MLNKFVDFKDASLVTLKPAKLVFDQNQFSPSHV